MSQALASLLSRLQFREMERRERFLAVLEDIQAAAPNLRRPNFQRLASSDLVALYRAIDRHFLENRISTTIGEAGHSLSFRVSQRMTSTGGCTTTRFHPRSSQATFQIAIAGQLLGQTWANQQTAIVCGVTCNDMREGLCRIMEHELLHLSEMLVWRDSSCAQPRFKSMAQRLFGHRASKHRLLTLREVAAKNHGLRPGDTVQFLFDGRQVAGKINRINKRATVLVPHPKGQAYSDGQRYLKYYVPLKMLVKQPR
ncbi:MAG: hypothetical protein ACKO0N_01365 [Planctomycetota bacterium]